MKCFVLAAIFCLPIPQFAQQPVSEIKFQGQTDFFTLPPDLYFSVRQQAWRSIPKGMFSSSLVEHDRTRL